MFTLVTGIVGRWRAVCVTALQRRCSDRHRCRYRCSVAKCEAFVNERNLFYWRAKLYLELVTATIRPSIRIMQVLHSVYSLLILLPLCILADDDPTQPQKNPCANWMGGAPGYPGHNGLPGRDGKDGNDGVKGERGEQG
ncbi:unnamed protein product [Ranitomeya imitator]|uniref:Uncharacterized protein n=1 Tax=Ranitomeya imitator TaxID=111125 RepID=A0ABN9L7W3_9NEOB|nr:unnamed protein product [Ranitomeya imitator]